ncbi:MAG TPA: helix-turn-helix domain-containing protein [Bacteroidales bacterium]|jgi:transposase|nr:helix-turn-helix domain-containing protein [Bacteroidales bacterium]
MNSEELVLLMKAENLNVKRVSTILSVTPTTVYRWIKGTRKIPDRVSPSIVALLRDRPRYLTLSGSEWRVD